MDDSALTSQAIAELMRDQNSLAYLKPQERKINPLGKPNKRFLGRTINNVLRHNKREIERTHASCQQKLQELDDSYERRKRNDFYREDYGERRSHRSRNKKKSKKQRHRSRSESRSSSRSSIRESRSRSRKHNKKSKVKKEKKVKKKRRKSNSYIDSSSEAEQQKEATEHCEVMPAASSEYFVHSNNLALAVAMAYNQAMSAQKTLVNVPKSPASPLSDIINELMSDEETELESKQPPAALSVSSSSDEGREILTIDLSSQEEQSDSTDNETDSETDKSTAVSCIALEDSEDDVELEQPNSGSDIEIIETEPERLKEELQHETKEPSEQLQVPKESNEQLQQETAEQVKSAADLATMVDLTED